VVLAVAAAADAADNEAASAMKGPVSVVAAFGTAVQRSPSIDVIENPAGRVAMVEIKSDASRRKERRNQPSRDNENRGSQAISSCCRP
jgi:hypothetical protein